MPARSHPTQHVLDLGGTDAVTVVGVDVSHLARPSAIAVAHDPDVVRLRFARERGGEPPLVDRIDEIPHVRKTIDRAPAVGGPPQVLSETRPVRWRSVV